MPYLRTVKTKSGATVQIVWSSREIEHIGSAHDDAELEAVKAAAQQRLAAGQPELDLGLEPAGGEPLPITSSRMGHLAGALERAYRVLGFEDAADPCPSARHPLQARCAVTPLARQQTVGLLSRVCVAASSRGRLLRGEVFVLRLCDCGKVVAQPLRTRLPDMQRSTDRTYRRNTISRQFRRNTTAARSRSGSVTDTSSRGHGSAVDAWPLRMIVIRSSFSVGAN